MVLITGHRGAAGLEPENTMRSFKKAISLGVDFIEFDIRMTKDKELAVIHDGTLERTTNGRGYVKDYTLGEIKKLDAGKGEKILALQEVITHLKNEKPVMTIEIKEPETLEQILSIIKTNNVIDKVILVSFWHETVKKAKELEPKIKTGAIIKARPIDTVSMVKACNADILCMNYVFLDKRLVEECHKNNIKI
ncbi:MAG: glycerophosphodiester phosphodiesterase family protein [archaeon]